MCFTVGSPRLACCLQIFAGRALAKLARKVPEAIVNAGGIEPLVALARSGDDFAKASQGGPPSPCAPRP